MTNIIKKLVKDLDENEGITLGNDVLPYMEKAIQQAIAEERERVWGIIDWELTPHGYESDDPQFERFAIKIKEKYKNKIIASLDKLTDKDI